MTDLSFSTFNFESLVPTEIPFTYQGVKYVLREADVEAENAWRGAMQKALHLLRDGKPGLSSDSVAEAELILLSKCVYEANQETGQLVLLNGKDIDRGKLVSNTKLRFWLSRVKSQLYRRLLVISNLGEGSEDTPDTLRRRISEMQERLSRLEASGSQTEAEEQAKN